MTFRGGNTEFMQAMELTEAERHSGARASVAFTRWPAPASIQERIDKVFETWLTVPSLASVEAPDDAEPILTVDDVIKAHVLDTLKRLHGNQTQTAKALGVDRRTLHRWLDTWKMRRRAICAGEGSEGSSA